MLATVTNVAMVVPVVVTEGISTVMQNRRILGDLANVSATPPKNQADAEEFIKRHGPLYPGSLSPEFDVFYYAERFRLAWSVETESEAAAVNRFLDDIFAADLLSNDPHPRPAIAANFLAGKWEPIPRNLLDALAVELARSRKMLHRCERPECQRYFVKEWSRDRYCSMICGEQGRANALERYHEKHREERNSKRRKPRKIVRR
jgi:hypothetical protein